MIIDGFQKLTLLDFPCYVACIIFTRGCNFKCPFCQNGLLINIGKQKGEIEEVEIFNYLKRRKGVIDGVVISGGEPLLQKNIKSFIKEIKKLGFLVKLDTNGYNYDLLKELIDENLLDYVAMDIKNIDEKYNLTVDKKINLDFIKKSISLLKKNRVDYEFRTTIVKEFHTLEDIKRLCEEVGSSSKYYLQNFENSDYVLNKNLHGFSKEELKIIQVDINKSFPNVEIRALS